MWLNLNHNIYSKDEVFRQGFESNNIKTAEAATYLLVDLGAGGPKKGCMKQAEALNTEVSSTELLYRSVPHSQTTT